LPLPTQICIFIYEFLASYWYLIIGAIVVTVMFLYYYLKTEQGKYVRDSVLMRLPLLGPLFVKMPLRNHKKILVIDDHISYIGGINFSDHNFAWHDIMLRIEGSDISSFLAEDFLASWEGRRFSGQRRFKDIELFSFDGVNNREAFQPIWDLIDGAEDSIYVQSPYLSHPFTDRLRDAVGRGIEVTVVTPEKNNKKPMDSYSRWEAARSGFDLRLYQKGMTHLKAMLIDEKYLIIGSCNFDYFSYHFEEETVAVVTNPEIIGQFINKIINHDDQYCIRVTNPEKLLSGRLISLQIKALGRLLGLINRSKW